MKRPLPLNTVVRLALVSGIVLISACAAPIAKPVVGFSCCNLRMEGGWVSSNNVQGGTLIPAGEPVQLTSIKKRFYVYGSIGGQEVALRDDGANTEADTLRWVNKLVVSDDPRQRLRAWPAEIRTAAQAGRVLVGMTREQVLFSLGYPSREDTPDLEASTWRYWTALDDSPVDLRFDGSGKLADLAGRPAAIRTVGFDS
ncbi:MAG: outer membrane protein assembly factor BamE [Luteimonas sp.]|nr:outer membrane protein assembly factor BamE [Luteimonas sp.]